MLADLLRAGPRLSSGMTRTLAALAVLAYWIIYAKSGAFLPEFVFRDAEKIQSQIGGASTYEGTSFDAVAKLYAALGTTGTHLFVAAVGALILWLISGVTIGVIAALRRGRWQDRLATGGALIGYSFPTFFIGLVLLYFVIFKFKIMAYPAYTPFSDDPVAWVKSFILPWITLALVFAAFYSRLTRNQMLDTLGEDYIRTARAKGLSERRVIFKHALRSGLTPIVTAAGIDLATLLGGVVITEQVFGRPGTAERLGPQVTCQEANVIAYALAASRHVDAASVWLEQHAATDTDDDVHGGPDFDAAYYVTGQG